MFVATFAFMCICNQDGNLKIWDSGMFAVSNMWIP